MKILELTLETHSYIFFSTIDRGSLIGSHTITGLFLHNYPLIYSINNVINDYMFYINQEKYSLVDKALNGEAVYVLPPKLINVKTRTFFYNVSDEPYIFKEKVQPHINAPSSGKITYIGPQSVYRTYAVVPENINLPNVIRLGKKREGVTKVEQKEIGIKIKSGKAEVRYPFNIKDCIDTRIINMQILLSPRNVVEEGEIAIGKIDDDYLVDDEGNIFIIPKKLMKKVKI